MLTDPLGDFFTRLRNGAKARREEIKIPHSKLKERILELLKNEGFLIDYAIEDLGNGRKSLTAQLKFQRSGDAVLENIRRISKPGHRIYSEAPKAARVRGGIGFQILSTNRGVISDREAIKQKVGGEVLGEVW